MDTANGPSEKANESTTEGGEMGANDQRLLAPNTRDHRSEEPATKGCWRVLVLQEPVPGGVTADEP